MYFKKLNTFLLKYLMSDFKTTQNKALLWNLMMETNVFAGVPEDNYEQVKSLFENEIETISNLHGKRYNSLTEMNKALLLEVTKKLNPFRRTNDPKPVLITNSDIQLQRRNEFSEHLTHKQKDFEDMITLKKPNEIDFTDTKDTPIAGNMEDVLAKMMEQREKDMHTPEPTAKKWINNAQPALIIEDIPKEKNHVRFSDTDKVDLLGFLGKPAQTPLHLLREMKKMHLDCMEKLDLCIKQIEHQDL